MTPSSNSHNRSSNMDKTAQHNERYMHVQRRVMKDTRHVQALLWAMGVTPEHPAYQLKKHMLFADLQRQFGTKASKGGMNKRSAFIAFHADGAYKFVSAPKTEMPLLQSSKSFALYGVDSSAVAARSDKDNAALLAVAVKQNVVSAPVRVEHNTPQQRPEQTEEEILAGWSAYWEERKQNRQKRAMRRLWRHVAATATIIGVAALAMVGVTKKKTPPRWDKAITTVVPDMISVAQPVFVENEKPLVKMAHDAQPAKIEQAVQNRAEKKTFSQAFAQARQGTLAIFTWQGADYTVDTRDEVNKWKNGASLGEYLEAGAPQRPKQYQPQL